MFYKKKYKIKKINSIVKSDKQWNCAIFIPMKDDYIISVVICSCLTISHMKKKENSLIIHFFT